MLQARRLFIPKSSFSSVCLKIVECLLAFMGKTYPQFNQNTKVYCRVLFIAHTPENLMVPIETIPGAPFSFPTARITRQ